MRENVLEVVREVADKYGVSTKEILGRDRHKTIAKARGMAMWLTRIRLDMSYSEIGQEFGRDHTTVVSSLKTVERWLSRA